MLMSFMKKIFLILGTALFLGVVLLSGLGLYLYYHPEQLLPIIERSLSAGTGSSCTIEGLSYSLQPLAIEAKGIHFKPLNRPQTFSIKVRFIRAQMAVEGPWGHRSLILKNMQMNGPYLELFSGQFTLPVITSRKKSPSFGARMVQKLIGCFLFQDIRFQSGEILDGRLSATMDDQTIRASKIQAKAGTDQALFLSLALDIQRPSRNMHFTAPNVNIHTGKTFNITDLNLSGTLQSRGMTLQSPDMAIRTMDVVSRFTYTHGPKTLNVDNLEVNCEGIAFVPLKLHIGGLSLMEKTDKPLPLLDINLKAKGIFHLPTNQLDVHQLNLVFADIAKMDGAFQAGLGPKGTLRLQVREASVWPEKGLAFLPLEVRQVLKSMKLEGNVLLKGLLAVARADEKWRWECDLESRLIKNPYAYVDGQAQLKGVVSAVIKAKGRFPDIFFSAEIVGDQNVLSANGLVLKPFKAQLSLSSRYPVIEIRDATVQIPQAKIETGTRDILIEDIRVHIPLGRIDTEKRSVALPEVRFDTAGLKNLIAAVGLQGHKLNLTIQGGKTDLLHAAAAYGLLPSDWDLTVLDAIQIRATGEKDGPWQVQAKLSLEDLIFQNKAGSLMGDKISLMTRIEGVVDLKRSKIIFNAALQADAGEALYDRYYLNLKINPIATSCQGSYHFQKRSLEFSKLKFDLRGIFPLEIQGFLKQGQAKTDADFTVTLPQVPLQPIFHHMLQEPYKTEKPFLANLDTGGNVSAEFKIKGGQNAWQVMGRLGWHGGNLSTGEKDISLRGIQLDLPIWYRTGSTGLEVETLKGRLEVQSATAPLLPEQPLSILLNAGPNRISVESPTIVQVSGGKLRLGAVEINNIFGPDISIHTRLEFDSVKLQPLLSRVWMRPLEGTLTGVLDPVRYEKYAVTSQGEITAKIFGGQIRLYDLGASGIFTLAPAYTLNAQWDDLLLSEMTTDTAFGKIEGVLKGHIRDFEIAYGQPQRFDLLLETIKKKRIPQRISLRAVENIAQIGGGQSPFMGLAGGFASLFKTFPYQKIGIQAYLENDVFMINGTIKEGGTEYLVKRGSFSGVNVVNQNTDNRIRFKDMLKRVKRITSKGGSVVK